MTRRVGGSLLARPIVLVLALGLAAGGCLAPGSGGSPDASGALRVVATTTVFADLVRQVGGDEVVVTSLVPKGGEVHTFDPAPSTARAIAGADLIVMNGLGLDDWLGDLAANVGTGAPILRLGEDLPDVEYIESAEGATVNPHLWLDVALAKRYVERIRDALIELRPADSRRLAEAAAEYLARLAELDQEVRAGLAALPAAQRRVVSFHDAFPYYARAYGLTIVGTVVRAPGQEPSAGEVGALVDAIREADVSAILSEAQFSDAVVQTIADETGATVVTELYSDSLGDPPVETFEALIRWNTERILAAIA